MKVVNHRLVHDNGTPIDYHPSKNFTNKVIKPEYLILHYTAGRTAESAIAYLSKDYGDKSVSAHLVIARDGTVTQLVDFNKIAWHAGVSKWEGRDGLNRHSIGIEIDNAGKLDKVGEEWQSWFKMVVPPENVMVAAHKNYPTKEYGWHTFTPEQIDAVIEVGHALFAKYKLLDVIGHDDVAPNRKIDPGPAFPMESVRSRLTGRKEDVPVYFEVVADELNIRCGPGTQHNPIPGSPLLQGTTVEVERVQGNWSFVHVVPKDPADGVDMEGWVHNHFIKRLPPV